MASPLPARWDGIGPVPPSMVAVLQSSGPRASVIEFQMDSAAKISPRTSSALAIDEWTRRLRDICGTFGLTAVIENDMPSVTEVREAMVGASEKEVLDATTAAQQKWLLMNAEYYHVFRRYLLGGTALGRYHRAAATTSEQ